MGFFRRLSRKQKVKFMHPNTWRKLRSSGIVEDTEMELTEMEKKIANHYFYTEADETEIKLMAQGNAKKLYKYGVDNDKPWVWFSSESPDIEEIQRAMDLVSSL